MASTTLRDAPLARAAARIGRELRARGQRVATAESCTGGWIAKAMTDVAGSSDWFEAGFVVYSYRAKQRQLGVSPALLKAHGAVSRAVVRAMAQGALAKSGANIAVAVSGIAGPGGALQDKPVGTVWFCWARRGAKGVTLRTAHRRFRGDRELVRRKTVREALLGLRAR